MSPPCRRRRQRGQAMRVQSCCSPCCRRRLRTRRTLRRSPSTRASFLLIAAFVGSTIFRHRAANKTRKQRDFCFDTSSNGVFARHFYRRCVSHAPDAVAFEQFSRRRRLETSSPLSNFATCRSASTQIGRRSCGSTIMLVTRAMLKRCRHELQSEARLSSPILGRRSICSFACATLATILRPFDASNKRFLRNAVDELHSVFY